MEINWKVINSLSQTSLPIGDSSCRNYNQPYTQDPLREARLRQKARGKAEATTEAEKLNLKDKYLYHSLLGELYTGIDNTKAISHLQTGIALSKSEADKVIMSGKIDDVSRYILKAKKLL